jgi:4-hydroxybenzoate polyprenyltransferase
MDVRTALALVRPFTMLAPATGVLFASAAASAATGARYDPVLVGLALVSATLANAASNAWNQAYDADLDRVNKPERPIPSGRASVRAALTLGHLCALLSLAAGAAHAATSHRPWFLACVTFGVLSTWVYSAPPLRTKRLTLGALVTIAIPRGFLVPVAGWAVVSAPNTAEPFALGLVPGLFVLGAAATKDFADVEGDRAHGCRTLPVVLGARRAARIVAPFLVVPFLLYPVLSAAGFLSRPLPAWVVAGAALATGGLLTARALVSDPDSLARERNHPAWRGMYLLMLANQAVVAAVYLFA